jgi:hypothetical protein
MTFPAKSIARIAAAAGARPSAPSKAAASFRATLDEHRGQSARFPNADYLRQQNRMPPGNGRGGLKKPSRGRLA